MPDATLIVLAGFLVPLLTEVLTKSGLAPEDEKTTKRIVATVLTVAAMAAQFLLTGDPVPGLEELAAQFVLLRAAVEAGHAAESSALKTVGVDADNVLFPRFGVAGLDASARRAA